MAQSHPDWILGFQDETWWSRYKAPALHAWATADQQLHLVEQSVPKQDTEPKALACYGLLLKEGQEHRVWLRFVHGRPVSAITTQYLAWSCDRLQAVGKKALLLVWDNASWHVSKAVRRWIREHNQQVKRAASGVRIVPCYLPSKSPWLNPIEPCWTHAKRCVVEPERTLSADELAQRICAHFMCAHEPCLTIPESLP